MDLILHYSVPFLVAQNTKIGLPTENCWRLEYRTASSTFANTKSLVPFRRWTPTTCLVSLQGLYSSPNLESRVRWKLFDGILRTNFKDLGRYRFPCTTFNPSSNILDIWDGCWDENKPHWRTSKLHSGYDNFQSTSAWFIQNVYLACWRRYNSFAD